MPPGSPAVFPGLLGRERVECHLSSSVWLPREAQILLFSPESGARQHCEVVVELFGTWELVSDVLFIFFDFVFAFIFGGL